MSTDNRTLLQQQLESLIDQHGPGAVLSAFATVTEAKATHIAEHWQDVTTAKAWSKLTDAVLPIADRAAKLFRGYAQ